MGQGAPWRSRSPVLPGSTRPRWPVWLDPTTMSPACSASASSWRACAGEVEGIARVSTSGASPAASRTLASSSRASARRYCSNSRFSARESTSSYGKTYTSSSDAPVTRARSLARAMASGVPGLSSTATVILLTVRPSWFVDMPPDEARRNPAGIGCGPHRSWGELPSLQRRDGPRSHRRARM